MKKGIAWLIIVVIALGLLWATSRMGQPTDEATGNTATTTEETLEFNTQETTMNDVVQTHTATVTTNRGTIVIGLYGEAAPNTVGNFVKLANEGFYNGTRFHRVIDGFMIQGGDPNSKDIALQAQWGMGGPGYKFDDEFGPGLSNVRGTISMANSGPNTNGSQFFINLVDNTPLDHDKQPLTSKHAVFGMVIEGMDVVDAIGASETVGPPTDRPVDEVVVQNVVIAEL